MRVSLVSHCGLGRQRRDSNSSGAPLLSAVLCFPKDGRKWPPCYIHYTVALNPRCGRSKGQHLVSGSIHVLQVFRVIGACLGLWVSGSGAMCTLPQSKVERTRTRLLVLIFPDHNSNKRHPSWHGILESPTPGPLPKPFLGPTGQLLWGTRGHPWVSKGAPGWEVSSMSRPTTSPLAPPRKLQLVFEVPFCAPMLHFPQNSPCLSFQTGIQLAHLCRQVGESRRVDGKPEAVSSAAVPSAG